MLLEDVEQPLSVFSYCYPNASCKSNHFCTYWKGLLRFCSTTVLLTWTSVSKTSLIVCFLAYFFNFIKRISKSPILPRPVCLFIMQPVAFWVKRTRTISLFLFAFFRALMLLFIIRRQSFILPFPVHFFLSVFYYF